MASSLLPGVSLLPAEVVATAQLVTAQRERPWAGRVQQALRLRRCIFQDSSDDMRKVQRREKNRIAAQKSRQRQTQKADTLHLESEDLERQNAALRREIKQLTEEMKHFTSMLSSHEPLCSILTTVPQPPPEVLYATHSFHQPHISSPRFQH
ncbi:basic leucine zipper transcriptional factor ATF-like isoform X1 [Chrysemys picta bellii]|uniref:basic leucine zipper transcriptional factor ATF-like isoform X1 n=1 Tax=Chrysemys picta bellii TaxID=8478 RepID=UPI0032B189A8